MRSKLYAFFTRPPKFHQFPGIRIKLFCNKLKGTFQSVKRYGEILRANYHFFLTLRSYIIWKPVVNLCTPKLKIVYINQLAYTWGLLLLKTLNHWSVRSILIFSISIQSKTLYVPWEICGKRTIFTSAWKEFLESSWSPNYILKSKLYATFIRPPRSDQFPGIWIKQFYNKP